jgi:uncharacterized protein YciI
MFIIDVEYTVDLSQIDAVLAEHRAWLDIYFQNGTFIFSGPTKPRTGGIIIAKANSKAELEQLVKHDPYALHDVARHTISEFKAIKAHPELVNFIEN